MKVQRKKEMKEYSDAFERLARELSPEQLAARMALMDAAFIVVELLTALEEAEK